MVTAKEIRDEDEREEEILKSKFRDLWDKDEKRRLEEILPTVPEDAREGFIKLVTNGELSPEWEKRWEENKEVEDALNKFFHEDAPFKAAVSEVMDITGPDIWLLE